MSVLANNVKMKFAGLLRGLLRRVDTSESTVAAAPRSAAAPLYQRAPVASAPASPVSRPPASVTPQPPVRPRSDNRNGNSAELELSLLPIVERLPDDIRTKWFLGGMDLSQATISIPVEKILPQLAVGAVKISFGELRNAVPELFRSGDEYDSLPIPLPLNEILSRLNPALISRHPSQRAVAPPAEISEVFGPGAKAVTITTAPAKPATTHFYKKPAIPQPSEPIKMPATPLTFAQRPTAPVSASPASPMPAPSRLNRPAQPSPSPIPIRPSTPLPKPSAPPAPAFVPQAVPAPSAVPLAAPRATAGGSTILAPLAELSENWPEALRHEITQLDLTSAQVALPVHLIEPALKRGRVIFAWHHVRSWIRPNPPGVSIHDGVELELPLNVIAPLFLPKQKARSKAALPPSSVPNLFFGFPQPQPEDLAAPVGSPEAPPVVTPLEAKPTETNYYVWRDGTDSPRIDETDYKRVSVPATDFSSRRAMPAEIVQRAMKLPGVAGAVIALPDGLKVAFQVPPELNADTVAAFLPQLFSRVSQCARELRMGDLNNLNFTIGNIPWKIFRVNAVYFAAFGCPGEPLPTAQLAQLAAELDRKK